MWCSRHTVGQSQPNTAYMYTGDVYNLYNMSALTKKIFFLKIYTLIDLAIYM